MNKGFLIFRHEFLFTTKRTGFIILTLALPVLALLGIGIFRLVSGTARPEAEATKVGYVDEFGGFEAFNRQGKVIFRRFPDRQSATHALIGKEITQYFVIPDDFLGTGRVDRYTTQRELAPPIPVSDALARFLTSNLLSGKVAPDVVARIEAPPNVVTTTLTAAGAVAPEQGGYGNFIIPAVFALLLALALTFNSAYLIQSLAEEKENRLMEILLSSVSTRQILVGKVTGLGAAGLVQVLVWAVSLPLLLLLASSSIGGMLRSIQLPSSLLILGVVYFILGYLLFAVVSAGVAAISSSVREAQGMAPIFTLFSIAPFWFISLLMLFPHSAVWVVFSIFPFSAPTMMMLRLGLTGVPAWQLAAGMGVLVLCIAGGLLLAAKLLRMYLLMYGKRPTLTEIARSFKSG